MLKSQVEIAVSQIKKLQGQVAGKINNCLCSPHKAHLAMKNSFDRPVL